VEKTVVGHSRCWHTGPPRQTGSRDERTRARHAAVHTLLDQGVGLLECARRLGWALNTVKRYTRAATAEDLQRPAQYRQILVDPYRDHLRRRSAEEPGVAVTRLLAEIRELRYPGSANLLVRYLKLGEGQALTLQPPQVIHQVVRVRLLRARTLMQAQEPVSLRMNDAVGPDDRPRPQPILPLDLLNPQVPNHHVPCHSSSIPTPGHDGRSGPSR
jgi:hypothetical protein